MFCNLMIRFAVFPTEKRFICSPISYQYLGNLDHIYKLVHKSVLNISFLDLNLIFCALTRILYFGFSEAFDVLGSVKHLIFWALWNIPFTDITCDFCSSSVSCCCFYSWRCNVFDSQMYLILRVSQVAYSALTFVVYIVHVTSFWRPWLSKFVLILTSCLSVKGRFKYLVYLKWDCFSWLYQIVLTGKFLWYFNVRSGCFRVLLELIIRNLVK